MDIEEFDHLCRQYWMLFGDDAGALVTELIKSLR